MKQALNLNLNSYAVYGKFDATYKKNKINA